MNLVKRFEKHEYHFPKFPCICCERLHYKSYAKNWRNFHEKENMAWLQVLALPILLGYYNENSKHFVYKNSIPLNSVK